MEDPFGDARRRLAALEREALKLELFEKALRQYDEALVRYEEKKWWQFWRRKPSNPKPPD